MHPFDYIRDPAEIYRESFSIVEREAQLSALSASEKIVATRMIHACGMVDLEQDMAFSEDAVAKGKAALEAGAVVYCDVEMVRSGIITKRLPDGVELACTLNDPRVADHAVKIGNTRSAAAVDFWDRLDGCIAVFGNAPTALFRLLERLDEGAPKPAVVVGMPVGFVGAAESKQALSENRHGLDYIVVHGRRGGSAIASAALNALAGGLS